MTLRLLRFSFLFLAIMFAAACGGGDDTALPEDLGELGVDDSGLIATFDVGYEVPLDIPEDLQNRDDNDASAASDRGDRVVADDPPDGLPMADDGAEGADDRGEGAGDDAVDDPRAIEGGSEDAWPADPNLRDDGLLYVRSAVRSDGQWNSISLLSPDGQVVWSYQGCDASGCTHDDILVLENGNVAVTATSTVDGRLVDNVIELEPVIGDGCASDDYCTGIARHSRLDVQVPDGQTGAITLLDAAEDYSSWDVLTIADGSTFTIPAL